MPVRQISGGRLSYLCPLPGHVETKPSFIVWTESEFENFYCFGCTRHSTIINLVRYIEGLSFEDALTKLSDGLEIHISDGAELEIEKYVERTKKASKSDMSDTLLSISSMCYSFLRAVKFNPVEYQLIDQVYSMVDNSLFEYDFEGIENIHKTLPALLEGRRKKILDKVYIKCQQQSTKT